MLLAVIALTLTAAVLHATWNAVLKGAPNTLVFSARAVSSSGLALTPVVWIAWWALGRPALPVGLIQASPSGQAITVATPFRTTQMFRSEARLRAAVRRSFWMSAIVRPVSRAI